jgi:outer membrane protein OmpA-like peptidoglycan-associated protein
MFRPTAVAWVLVLGIASSASAQNGSSGTSAAQNPPGGTSSSAAEATRPATTTFYGDTGLWFVPTAEVLPHAKWSVSGYRRGTNFIQGFSNVGDFAGTFGVGIKNRLEIFGSFLFDTRIDRDLRPLFINDSKVGGIIDRYPFDNKTWTGNKVGDLYLGAKINLMSEAERKPAAAAVRVIVKAPTGDDAMGVSTGKLDTLLDFIVSKEVRRAAEVSGYAGYEVRGTPDGFDAPGGAFRWGAGAAFPSRSALRGVFELTGLVPNSDTVTITGPRIVGVDSSLAPLVSATENITRANFGVTWQHRSGFFIGGGVAWNVPTQDRSGFNTDSNDASGDFVDWQVRLGYHPGTRVFVAPPPPPPPPLPPPPPPAVQQNRPPNVKAQCDPCTVEVGRTATVTANASDPDGDVLTYRWTAPQGMLANPAERQSLWTAPQQEGSVQVTVSVNDGKGGTASDSVTIQVTRPPVKNYTFEDVHFDFDRYSLRPEATRVLDDAVAALQQDATLRIQIEGHTCNIGTAEYNLALGDRRANAVRDYLISRGVPTARLSTVTYGEERPKYDNAREETRRLNRRAALVVNLQR